MKLRISLLVSGFILSLFVLGIGASSSFAQSVFPDRDAFFGDDSERQEVGDDNGSIVVPDNGGQGVFEGEQNSGTLTERPRAPLPDGNLFTEILPKVLQFGLYALGVVLFVAFVYAGIYMLISQGEEEKITKVKEMILHVIIGSVIIGGSFALVAGLANALLNI